jgi:Domain of unknown function (DUF4436)
MFTDVRPAETGLIGSLAAIAFALPVLRNALPGSPPLGVQADMWVFLWAELAAVLALALVLFKWANGRKPVPTLKVGLGRRPWRLYPSAESVTARAPTSRRASRFLWSGFACVVDQSQQRPPTPRRNVAIGSIPAVRLRSPRGRP